MTPQNRCIARSDPGWPPTAEKCLHAMGGREMCTLHVHVEEYHIYMI